MLALPTTSIAATQPNILLLMPDQWRWDWDGAAHADAGKAPPLHLPNIESLREKGTSFPRGAVVPAPVCAPSRSCMASLREYDHAGTATNFANDYQADKIPTYFSALQDAGYHTMSTGKDDLTKATQLGYKLGKDTRNGSDTYHARMLGFSDSVRFSGKDDVVSTFPTPHEPYGYMLNASVVKLANGTSIDAYAAHRACLTGKDAALCEASTYPHELYEDDWTAAQVITPLPTPGHAYDDDDCGSRPPSSDPAIPPTRPRRRWRCSSARRRTRRGSCGCPSRARTRRSR